MDKGTFRASVLRQPDAALGAVVDNVLLTSADAPVKRHIGVFNGSVLRFPVLIVCLEFELPEGLSYRAGDYLAM